MGECSSFLSSKMIESRAIICGRKDRFAWKPYTDYKLCGLAYLQQLMAYNLTLYYYVLQWRNQELILEDKTIFE